MSQNEQYDPKVLRKLQLAELEVFKDFIKYVMRTDFHISCLQDVQSELRDIKDLFHGMMI